MDENAIGRRPLESRDTRWALTLARGLAQAGVAPNTISVASVVVDSAGAICIALARDVAPAPRAALFVGAAVCVQLRLLANLLDGMVATEHGRATATGPLYNEVPDRLADIVLIGAAGAIVDAMGGTLLGATAALAAVLTAYVRTLGTALGAGTDFSGPMAKPQRMAVLTAGLLASAVETAFGLPLRAMGATLVVITLGSIATAARRLRRISLRLSAG